MTIERAIARFRSTAWPLLLLALCGLGWSDASQASDTHSSVRLGDPRLALPERSLDRIRGGYQLPSGVLMTFGIERTAYVNGQLAATQRLELAGDAANALVLQTGAGNHVAGNQFNGVLVQNTLDNQAIAVNTRIDASVGSLGMFQALNTQAALQGALQGAVGP